MIKLKKINLYHLDYPLKNYVVASFGLMKSRPALILELTDTNDDVGLGEIWCNFPSDGASYKFKIFKKYPTFKLSKIPALLRSQSCLRIPSISVTDLAIEYIQLNINFLFFTLYLKFIKLGANQPSPFSNIFNPLCVGFKFIFEKEE